MMRFEWTIRLGLPALLAASLSVPAAAETLTVHVDQAALASVPDRVTTLIVGNPMIADVSLQPDRLLVITGKSYGTTNLIALDRSGAVLMEREITVRAAKDQTVFLYRGVLRETYSCTPNCEPRINLGDAPPYFTATAGQSTTRNNLAAGSAAPSRRPMPR